MYVAGSKNNNTQKAQDEYMTYLKNKVAVQNYYKPVGDVLWNQKQQDLYPNSFITNQIPSIGQFLITEQNQKIYETKEPEYYSEQAELLLRKIADPTNAKYIVDRLEPDEQQYLINFFPDIEREVQKHFKTGLNRDLFIDFIKRRAVMTNVNFNHSLSNRAQNEQAGQALAEAKRQADYQQELLKYNNEYKAPFENNRKVQFKSDLGNLLNKTKKEIIQKEALNEHLNIYQDDDLFNDIQNDIQNNFVKAQAEAKKRQLLTELQNRSVQKQASNPIVPGTENDNNFGVPISGVSDTDLTNPINLNPDDTESITTTNLFRTPDKKLTNFYTPKNPFSPERIREHTINQFKDKSTTQIVNYIRKTYDVGTANQIIEGGRKNINLGKTELLNSLANYKIQEKQPSNVKKMGSGFEKKLRYGKGMAEKVIKCNPNEHDLGKFFLDKSKLENNILCLKYKSTRNTHPNMRLQRISSDVKDVLTDIMKGEYDERLYRKLKPIEKQLINNIVRLCHLPIELDPLETKRFQQKFDVLLGEFRSGNDNKELKNQLKEYVLYGLNEGKLKKHEAFDILYELSL